MKVEDVAGASEELKAKGYTLLLAARKELWGQTVTRLLSPEGIWSVLPIRHGCVKAKWPHEARVKAPGVLLYA